MRICSRCKALLAPDARTCAADGAAPEDVEHLPQGAKIAGYRIEKLLGEGGMGFVYEATHEVLHRRSAIKFLRPEFAGHTEVVTRFLNEAKAVNVIDHANIINVYDYGDGADGSVYFVMEYLEGETLDDLMRKRRPMPLPLLLHVFAQVGRALAAAHAKKIVHRDLKPMNVYVVAREDNPYYIKLLDFGIAQLRGDGAEKITRLGSVMGTPQYMSPEQVMGNAVDARTDVWALGVMIYKAVTGHAPFAGEGFAQLAAQILQETPKKPSVAAPDAKIPASLDKLVMSCLERTLTDRCQSIAEVLEGLERVKREAKLDDDAILAAVRADSGAIDEPIPVSDEPKTRASLAGSLPQYQAVPAGAPKVAESTAPAKSKTGLFVAAGVAVAVLAVGGWALFGRGGSGTDTQTAAKPTTPAPNTPTPPAPPTTPDPPKAPAGAIKDKAAAGDLAAVHQLAEAQLHDAIASGNLQQQGQAVDALDGVGSTAAAPLLYAALKGAPEVRVKAARALGGLALPDAAPKVRAALGDSGDKVRVELAATLYGLGDKEALAILKRATSDPGMRLTAAVALANAGDDKDAKPVLTDIFESTPEGREQWRRAAAGLLKLNDTKAKAALEAELSQPDAARAVAAADVLAKYGDDKAKQFLTRVAGDAEFARRGEAVVALARMGDASQLAWVDTGLASTDTDERRLATVACARLAKQGGDKYVKQLAAIASDDPDHGVRLAAAAALFAL